MREAEPQRSQHMTSFNASRASSPSPPAARGEFVEPGEGRGEGRTSLQIRAIIQPLLPSPPGEPVEPARGALVEPGVEGLGSGGNDAVGWPGRPPEGGRVASATRGRAMRERTSRKI